MDEAWKYCLWYGARSMELAEGKLTVGRSRHCDLSIQEPSISRKHVFMTIEAGEIRVQDLGSSNGTYVNDAKIKGESALHDGDHLRLGNAELQVKIFQGEGVDPAKSFAPEDVERDPSVESHDTDPMEENPGQWGMSLKNGGGEADAPEATALHTALAPDDPDLVPTKHLDSPSIDWDLLKIERAGFWIRLAAVAVDGLWVSALSWVGDRLGGVLSDVPLWGSLGALLGPVALLFTTWLGWGLWGTTPGKRLFGLYVFAVDAEEPGRPGTGLMVSAIRVASATLSVLLFGLGFLAIAFSPMRQALHDRLAATFVVKKPKDVKAQ